MSYENPLTNNVEQVIDRRDNDASIINDNDNDEQEISIEIEIKNSFYDNLATTIIEIDELSMDLYDKFDEDREARSKRDEQYNEGIRRAGLDEDASPGGADFEGSSEVVHPMIAENCIDFASREIKELAPPNGPVKAKIVGNATTEKIDISQRKTDFLNLILTEYTPYRNVLDKMLTQLPLGGSQFIKFWHDEHLKRPMCEFLPIDKVFIPYSCNDFYTADRVSVYSTLSHMEYTRRVNSGMYYEEEEDIPPTADINELSKSEQTTNAIEGKTRPVTQLDESVNIIEMFVYLTLEDDEITKGEYAPYIVTIREDTNEILSVYRNWREGDEKFIKLDYIVMFDFIPWRGAYGIGLGQIIGSLSVGATGALRALLDSAHVNNVPTALALKGIKMAGQTTDMQVGQMTMIEGPTGFDGDIKKLIMPLPFNPPSPTLFSLLEWLTNAAGRLVKMPDGGLDSMGDRTPASTSLAMIEQNSMTQSAIHQRLHHAQSKCFKIVCRLLADYYDPKGYPVEVIETLKINEALFKDTSDIIPVSDPNIFTSSQRYAQMQLVTSLNQQFPGLLNPQEIVKRTLQLAQISDPELLMNMPNNISRSNPMAENMAVALGQQIGAFPEQDHLAHFKVHASWLMSPLFGQNPLYQDKVAIMAKHLKEHLAFLYASAYQTVLQSMGDVTDNIAESKNDTGAFDKMLVDVTPAVEQYLQQELSQYQQVLQFVTQSEAQQAQQAQMANPETAKVQIEQQKLQFQQQQAQTNAQMQQAQMQQDAQQAQVKAQLQQQEQQVKHSMVENELRMTQGKHLADLEIEQLKLRIEEMKAVAGIKTNNDQLEQQILALLMQQINKTDEASHAMEMEQQRLAHEIHMDGIKHAQEMLKDGIMRGNFNQGEQNVSTENEEGANAENYQGGTA